MELVIDMLVHEIQLSNRSPSVIDFYLKPLLLLLAVWI